jgi:hypothetical protein
LSTCRDYGNFARWPNPGDTFMRRKPIVKIILAVALAAASLSPALAAKSKAKANLTGACAQPNGRCISDCDATNWCVVHACVNGQSTPMPFWRCYQPSGLCLAPHC